MTKLKLLYNYIPQVLLFNLMHKRANTVESREVYKCDPIKTELKPPSFSANPEVVQPLTNPEICHYVIQESNRNS